MEKRTMPAEHQASWNTATFDDSRWKSAEVVQPKETQIRLAILSADTRRKSARREESNESGSRRVIFDFEQNLSGVARIRANGFCRDGRENEIAEVLNPDGSLYVDNLRTAKATDHFILAGNALKSSNHLLRFTVFGM